MVVQMTDAKYNDTEIKEINTFKEMKTILEQESEYFCHYLITYNVRISDRTVTRSEDF